MSIPSTSFPAPSRRAKLSVAKKRLAAAALAIGLPLAFAPGSASAQTTWQYGQYGANNPAVQTQAGQNVAPRISAFDVKAIDKVEAGAELEFTLWGTPGSDASLRIDGAQRALGLVETSPGVYQGTYTVNRRDRIAADAKVNASLRRGNLVSTAVLDEPLQQGTPWQTAQDANLQIASFTVAPIGRSNTLEFTLKGTPGGRAVAVLPGSAMRRLILNETSPGTYTGQYTVQPQDQIEMDKPVSARLRVGDRVAVSQSARGLDGVYRQVATRGVNSAFVNNCAACATVQSVNKIQVDGDGNHVGTIAGGVLGAVLGNQVGKGDGRKAATVAGAVGGALLGRKIQGDRNAREKYEVVVKMNASGNRESVVYDQPPAFKAGDAVRLENGQLRAEGSF